MVNKLFVASTTRKKMLPEKSLGIGWGSLKLSFHSLTTLLLPIMLSHQAFVLVVSRIIQIFDRATVISYKVWRTSVLFRWPLWFLRNIPLFITKLKDCLDLWQNEEATSDCHQWPSMRRRLWIPLHCWIHHFSCTTNSKYRFRKNIRIREKNVYTAKLSEFKSFRIESSHFKFLIQNLRRHDQTGMFSRQNQSGTKTFRIRHESGTISSSLNLVLMHQSIETPGPDPRPPSQTGKFNIYPVLQKGFLRPRGQ